MRAILFLSIAALSATIAYAESHHKPIQAALTEFRLDASFPLRLAPREGSVAVDFSNQMIQLSIGTGYMTFPENVHSDDYSFYNAFDLKDQHVEKCNVVVYLGERVLSLRPPFAIVRDIEVRDNTGNTCPTFVPLAPTEVIVTDREVSRLSNHVTATSVMTGEALR